MSDGNGRCKAALLATSALALLGAIALFGAVSIEVSGKTAPSWLVGVIAAIIGWLSGLLTPVPRPPR